MKDNDNKQRWREYFNKLLNKESIGGLGLREDTSLVGHVVYHKIIAAEVKRALARMKMGKFMGPDCFRMEAWKSLGETG